MFKIYTMKRNVLLVLLLVIPFLLNAQKLKLITKKFLNSNVVKMEYTVLKNKKHIKHGDFKTYFENGQIKKLGVYNHNKKEGDWKEYDYHGKLKRLKKYEGKKKISDEKYGVWKEVGKNGKLYFYDYDKNERIIPPIPIPVTYPRAAREEGISGVVKVKVKLDKTCQIQELKIVNSLRSDFDQEAIKGVKKYIDQLTYYEDDCKEFDQILTIEFKGK